MTRNLKALGLALVAAMALGAIGAQGASAVVEHSFRSAAEDTVVTGHIETSETLKKHYFEPSPGFGLPVECSQATFEGTNLGKERDTVTVHPKYSSCEFNSAPASVHTDGCNYIFDSDTTTSTHSSSDEHAAVSIECEPEHDIVVTTSVCKLTFTDEHEGKEVNQSLHGVRFTQLTSHGPSSKHALTVTATVQTVHYTALAGSFCGLGGISVGTHNTGVYTGLATVTGYDSSSVVSGSTTTGRTWSHGAQVDLTISTPT